MARGSKPAKVRVTAGPPFARKSARVDGSTGRQLEQRLTEALAQQAATSEILRVISSSRTDFQPVLNTIVASAARLCDSTDAQIFRVDGDVLRPAASYGELPKVTAGETRPLNRGSVNGRAVLDRRTIHVHDLAEESESEWPEAKAFQKRFGHRTVLATPLLRAGIALGAMTIRRMEVRPFSDDQIRLLETFADQAVIAIQNVRVFTELQARNRALTEALEQQTATSEILRVISRSPTDVQPVFDAIAERAAMLCGAKFAFVTTYDGEWIHMRATHGPGADEHRAHYPIRPGSDSIAARAIHDRIPVQIPDFFGDAEYAHKEGAQKMGIRSGFGVPMMREGQILGAIALARPEAGVVPDNLVRLLHTFADQAVIAIENVRLFKELETRNRDLTEALEQQTATSEILRVISRSPTDVQPVFDTIAAAALKLCRASSALVFTFDGELIHLAAAANLNTEGADAWRQSFPRPPSRDTAATRSVLTCSVEAVADVLEDPEYAIGPTAATTGFRSALAVPLIRDAKPIGVIGVGRPDPGLFPDNQVALLKTFADQAVIAIENVRLFKELEARNGELTEALEQRTATAEILQVISSSHTDVKLVFDTIVRNAARLCDAMFAAVHRFDGGRLHFVASSNSEPHFLQLMQSTYPMRPDASQIAGRVVLEKSVVVIEDALADPAYKRPLAIAGHWRRMLGVPMMRGGNPLGVIVVGWAEAGSVARVHKDLLKTFADQAVIAIENVRLFRELEARTLQLTRSVKELKALGEVGQTVSSTLDLDTVLSTIVSRAAELAGMNAGSIWEYDDARGEFYVRATYRLPDELIQVLRGTPIRKGQAALGRLGVTGEAVEIRDITDEPSYPGQVRELLVRCGYRSVLAVPLLREGRLLGALAVHRNKPGAFAPEVVGLLKNFATQSALAIQNARLFNEIQDKSRQLEIANKHKSEFLASMSHELRTPLNAIIGFSEVLLEKLFGEVNDKQEDYLKDIYSSGKHLLNLINDILDLSKVEAGRMDLERSTFDLPTALSNALTLVRERAQRHNLTLHLVSDPALTEITADERKLKQILVNLLTNAVKFTPDGGRIDVTVRREADAIAIAVRDTGIGIAPEDQEAVFEEFRQVGRDYTSKHEGTGLGLTLTRKFVELHGGRIWVESVPGQGSTFTFTIPIEP